MGQLVSNIAKPVAKTAAVGTAFAVGGPLAAVGAGKKLGMSNREIGTSAIAPQTGGLAAGLPQQPVREIAGKGIPNQGSLAQGFRSAGSLVNPASYMGSALSPEMPGMDGGPGEAPTPENSSAALDAAAAEQRRPKGRASTILSNYLSGPRKSARRTLLGT